MGRRIEYFRIVIFNIIILSFTVFQGILCQTLRSTYPVQVSAFMKPPYSLYLDDYSRLDAEKLILTLINRDLLQPEVEVRLHLRINAGNQVILESNDHKPLPAFHLVPGEPLQVSQSDLAAYFMKENLQASGAFSGRFPEGMLEICITVLDANTGRQLSQRTCARAWISLNRPPLLSLPLNQTKFPMREPQQFVFQWTPRHQGLSQVEYRLVLKEIPATQGAPENAFASAQEVFSTTVYGTSFAYNTAIHPPLLENMTYAWQVQAVARDGFNELNIFENQGYSEVRTFSMAASCYPPTGINQHQEGAFAVVGWTPPQPGTQSVISYRRSDATGQWHDRSVNQNHVNLTDLAFGVEYVCKVGTRCSDGTVTYGEEITFTLEDWRKKVEASCGVLPDPDLDRTTRLEELNPGDVFIAGDFPVYVTRIKNGAMGIFSGIGWTSLPMFMDAKVVVHFDNITLNAQKQLISGAVETSYDASEAGLADLDELTHGKTGTGQTVTGDIWSGAKANFEIPPGSTFKYDPKTNMLVVTDANGQPVGEILIPEKDRDKFTNTEPFTYVIQDSKENVYTISGDGKGENGEVTGEKTGTKNDDIKFNPEQISTKDVVIRFKQAPGANYAFDEWQKYYESVSLINNKKIYEHLGAYDVPCKLIPPGKADKVSYELEIIKKGGIDTSKIVFKTGSGYVLKHDASRQEIQLTGGNPNDAQDIYALYPGQSGAYQTVGKLKVLSYPEKSFKVKLIPVYDQKEKRIFTTDPGSIQKTLDKAFNPLGITWDVELDKPFEYPSADITSDGSGLLSRYSDEMKALNAAYKAERGTDKNTLYLFILNKGDIKGLNPAGEMPRGKQFGYIFTGNGGGNIPQTVAHELGHGRFQLQHTFDGEYGSEAAATKGRTDNLMEYDGGLHLAKWQWDEIFAQALIVNPFEGDEDAMATAKGNKISEHIDYDKLVKWLKDNKGKTIKYDFNEFLSKEYIVVSHDYGTSAVPIDKQYSEIINGKTVVLYLRGTLSTQSGNVTLIAGNSNIPLEINFDKDQITFYDNVYFDKKEGSSTKELAISLSTNNLEDFEKLLRIQGYDYGENAKSYYISKYKEAFTIASNDRNKIDILWENIPDFVGAALPDIQKWENLHSLSKGAINQIGTDEEKACINLIKGFSGQFLYQKLNEKYENSELVSGVFRKLSASNRVKFISAIVPILDDIWSTTMIDPKIVYIEESRVMDDYRWAISDAMHTTRNQYQFGHDYFCINDRGYKFDCLTMGPSSALPTYIHQNFINQFTIQPTDPVTSYVEGKNLIFPAFLAQTFIEERNANYKNEFLSLSIGSLLPEAFIKPATLAKWSKWFSKAESVGNTGQVIENIIDEVRLAELAKDIKYLPGPQLPDDIAKTFENLQYSNRKLSANERFFKYHGTNNRTGRKYAWYTNKKYGTEFELRQKLAIKDEWGVQIEYVSEFDIPAGTWVSEGKAASQGVGYPGQDYQAVILNTPKSWIIKTENAFK